MRRLCIRHGGAVTNTLLTGKNGSTSWSLRTKVTATAPAPSGRKIKVYTPSTAAAPAVATPRVDRKTSSLPEKQQKILAKLLQADLATDRRPVAAKTPLVGHKKAIATTSTPPSPVTKKAKRSRSTTTKSSTRQQLERNLEALIYAPAVTDEAKKRTRSFAKGESPLSGNEKKKRVLLDLSPLGLVEATMLRRPSRRNASPYVADAVLANGREVIVHTPSMEMGGKCGRGAKLLLKPARDPKGNLVGPNAVSPKYGTPKCEFIAQLLRVEEPENAPGCWIGAHPRIGENIAEELLQKSLVPAIRPTASLQKEFSGPAGCDMRADFVITHKNKNRTVLEVKTIVDTDYAKKTVPKHYGFVGPEPYSRAGIFPAGGDPNQIGPQGEKVVSARAIKHVRELTSIAKGERNPDDGLGPMRAAVLFINIRGDVMTCRPNGECCPSFSRYVEEARDAGVAVSAHRVRWGEGENLGIAFDDGPIPVTASLGVGKTNGNTRLVGAQPRLSQKDNKVPKAPVRRKV